MGKAAIKGIIVTMASIVLTGVVLDEAGRGTFGTLTADFARKVTRGYGI